MENRLNQNFHTLSLLKFTFPTTMMLLFMSLYQMVDGVFVANFVGEYALSALNIVYPIPSIIIAISIMLATGGSAIIAKNMGEKRNREAKENFSLILLAGLVFSVLFLVVGTACLEQIIYLLGATEDLYAYCHDYLLILVLATPLAVFQMLFQTFFVTAGRPTLGLVTTVVGGCVNVVFDYLFVAVGHMGVRGAAVATAMGYAVPAVVGLVYFTCFRHGTLYVVRPVLRGRVLLHSCTNGASEMVNNVAVSITTFLFNILMLRYAGEAGVAAITVVLYAQFLMTSVFMGFSSGVAPIVSYNYGKQNRLLLQRVFRISVRVVVVTSVLVFVLSELLSTWVVRVFAPSGSAVYDLAQAGFHIFSISFLFTGVNIFASALFTAFSDGKVSAILSFLRTFVFLTACLFVLPALMELDGIWLAVPVAEGLALLVSLYYLATRRSVYGYVDSKPGKCSGGLPPTPTGQCD